MAKLLTIALLAKANIATQLEKIIPIGNYQIYKSNTSSINFSRHLLIFAPDLFSKSILSHYIGQVRFIKILDTLI